MNTLNTYITGALVLIALYIIVFNASKSDQVISALSTANTSAIRALQGNTI
jgi:hypothetical protein